MLFALPGVLSLPGTASAGLPPACADAGVTVVSCAVEPKGHTLCLGMESATPGRLRHPCGTDGQVELAPPSAAADGPGPSGVLSSVSGGTALAVFTTGAHEYVVYSSQGGGRGAGKGDPDAWRPWLDEGVLVLQDGALVSNLASRENPGPSGLWRRMAGFAPATRSDEGVDA